MVVAQVRRISRQFLYVILVVIAIVICVACESILTPEERVEIIFPDVTSCNAPCWNQIEPGITTEEEFLVIAEANSSQFDNLKRSDVSTGNSGYTWVIKEADIFGSALIRDDRANILSFQPKSNLPLESIIQALGNPKSYVAAYTWGERPFVSLVLFYESEGVIVESLIWWSNLSTIDCKFSINDTMEVSEIVMTVPDTPTQLMNNIYTLSHLERFVPNPWNSVNSLIVQDCPL